MTAGIGLFVYGTLMDADLRRLVCGVDDVAPPKPAYAAGWRTVYMTGEAFPTLLPAPYGEVEGLSLPAPSEYVWRRLVVYEGAPYVPGTILVVVRGKEAERLTFVTRQNVPIRNWRLAVWQRRHKRTLLAHTTRFFGSYGIRAIVQGRRNA